MKSYTPTRRDHEFVNEWFPRAQYEIVGPHDWNYNCIANAFGVRDEWWWDDEESWDDGIEGWIRHMCAEEGWTEQFDFDGEPVPGQERIVFYAREDTGRITHGARQLPDGRWESKLGPGPLVIHATLECLVNDECEDDDCTYGRPYLTFVRQSGATNNDA